MTAIRIFLITTLVAHFSYSNNNVTSNRGQKVFSLFSIVQFPNDVCTTTSGTFSNGTCVTSSECTTRGGTAQGNCAAGFGVCCVYTYDSTSTVSQNTSYLINPGFPSNYNPTSAPTTLTYTIQKQSCDICRLRLDYETFELDVPSTTNTEYGRCKDEYMAITTTGQTVSPATTGNFGNYPMLCGTQNGLHSYVDLSCTCDDEAKIAVLVANSALSKWNIKVTQLSCNDPDVSTQEGCFQYFTGETGTFESYGLQNSAMLAQLNYAICIRPEVGHCCIEYEPTTFDMYVGSNSIAANQAICQVATAAAAAMVSSIDAIERCNGAQDCWQNYINIPGAKSPGMNLINQPAAIINVPIPVQAEDGVGRYCGTNLYPNGMVPLATVANSARLNPVVSCKRPFKMYHVTGGVISGSGQTAKMHTGTHTAGAAAGAMGGGGTGAINTSGAQGATGFKFNFRQIPGTC